MLNGCAKWRYGTQAGDHNAAHDLEKSDRNKAQELVERRKISNADEDYEAEI